MAFWGLGIVVAPMLGPVIGGYLTDNFSWRWVFYINLPVGLASIVMTRLFISIRPTSGAEWRHRLLGYRLLAVGVGALQIVLDKGRKKIGSRRLDDRAGRPLVPDCHLHHSRDSHPRSVVHLQSSSCALTGGRVSDDRARLRALRQHVAWCPSSANLARLSGLDAGVAMARAASGRSS